MNIITVVAIVSCVCSLSVLTILAVKQNKRSTLSIIFSVVGILSGIVALAIARPREPIQYGIDYLGIIVAILALLATLLLGMQLYNVFRLKEDADEVEKAKKQIDDYCQKVVELSEKISHLSDQSSKLEEEIKMLSDIASDLMEKSEHAVYIDPYDGPDDDK